MNYIYKIQSNWPFDGDQYCYKYIDTAQKELVKLYETFSENESWSVKWLENKALIKHAGKLELKTKFIAFNKLNKYMIQWYKIIVVKLK